jgi:hypothetical protein
MTTPQDPPVRNKQKARRSKQLAAWRAANASATETTKAAAPKAAPKKKAAAK